MTATGLLWLGAVALWLGGFLIGHFVGSRRTK